MHLIKKIIIFILFCYILIIITAIFNEDDPKINNDEIIVSILGPTNIKKYKKAYVCPVNDGTFTKMYDLPVRDEIIKKKIYYEENFDIHCLEDQIGTTLRIMGINCSGYWWDPEDCDLRIEMHYDYGWCLPFPTRSFTIHYSTLYHIKLVLVDVKNNNVIGEVKWKRPRTRRFPVGVLPEMVKKMLPIQNF